MEGCKTAGLPPPWTATQEGTEAYEAINERFPIILDDIIKNLDENKQALATKYSEGALDDVSFVIEKLGELKKELATDSTLTPVKDDVPSANVSIWNNILKEGELHWTTGAWLFVECYFYRRIYSVFTHTKLLKDFDYFASQKIEAWHSSSGSMKILGEYLLKFVEVSTVDRASLGKLFEACLWSNQCDLDGASKIESSSGDPIARLDKQREFIIANHLDAILDFLTVQHTQPIHIEYVIDNMGFELFADLCLADYMCSVAVAGSITFNIKAMPWFVSDVMSADFNWALDSLNSSTCPVFNKLGKRWRKYVDDGTWTIRTEQFWTLPHDYSKMKATDPQLYSNLSKGELVIVKGDLSFMKLMDVLMWAPDTIFKTGLRGFQPAPLVSIRTVKSDVVVGLPAGLGEQFDKEKPGWRLRGDYALILFSK